MYKQPKHYVDICNPADDTFMDDLNKHFIVYTDCLHVFRGMTQRTIKLLLPPKFYLIILKKMKYFIY